MSIIIRQATLKDCELIVDIGRVAVELSHRLSCSAEDMNHFLAANYTHSAINAELSNPENRYHIVCDGEHGAGFSKIILNSEHPNISESNVTKLDRIYLREEFFDRKLGFELLQFNIGLSRQNGQSGMWLFTWTGNERAINFYKRAGFTVIGSHQFRVSETHCNPNLQMFLKY